MASSLGVGAATAATPAASDAADSAGDAAVGPTEFVAPDPGAAQADESQANESQQNETDPVSLDVEDVENCGSRCRSVTANITNVGNETLTNVTAETRISAADDQIWTRTHRFGNLSANESANRTARISLGFGDAFRIAQNDGRVTINTTIRWDGGNATFSERRRVMGR